MNIDGDTATLNPQVRVISPSILTFDVDLSALTPGPWDITVTNPDGQEETAPASFIVLAPPPSLSGVSPREVYVDSAPFDLTITGRFLHPRATVRLMHPDGPLTLLGLAQHTAHGQITLLVDPREMEPDKWDLVVTNPDGQSGTMQGALTLTARAPSLTRVVPSYALAGELIRDLTLHGQHFIPGASVILSRPGSADLVLQGCHVISPSTLTCALEVPEGGCGWWTINIINPDGLWGRLHDAFEVRSPPPVIVSVVPRMVQSGALQTLHIRGRNFVPNSSSILTRGRSYSAVPLQILDCSPTHLVVQLDPSLVAPGHWSLTVTDPFGQQAVLPYAVLVHQPLPLVRGIHPVGIEITSQIMALQVTGEHFQPGALVVFSREGMNNLVCPDSQVISSHLIVASPDLRQSPPGLWTVGVVNPDGGRGDASQPLVVRNPSPIISHLTPAVVSVGQGVTTLTVHGRNFSQGMTISLVQDKTIVQGEVVVMTHSHITATFDLGRLSKGVWDLIAACGEGPIEPLHDALTVHSIPPTISSITPRAVPLGTIAKKIVLTGSNFQTGAVAHLVSEEGETLHLVDLEVISSFEVRSHVELTRARPGIWSVCLTNPDGASATQQGVFRVNEQAPAVQAIAPACISAGVPSADLTIRGRGFQAGSRVFLARIEEAEIAAVEVHRISSNLLSCKFDMSEAAPGQWTVAVRNPDGQGAILPYGLMVNARQPLISGMVPDHATAGDRVVTLTLTGDAFQPGAMVTIRTPGAPDQVCDAVLVMSDAKIACELSIAGLLPGLRTVCVTNPDGQQVTLEGAFRIQPDIGGHTTMREIAAPGGRELPPGILPTSDAKSRERDRIEVSDLIDKFSSCLGKREIQSIAALVSDDFTAIGPDPHHIITGKADLLASLDHLFLVSSPIGLTILEISANVTFDVAWVSGRISLELQTGGNTDPDLVEFLAVARLLEGSWRLSLFHVRSLLTDKPATFYSPVLW
jgi:ketosteroid isomerase-like protein